MTIRAQKDTLSNLGACALDRATDAVNTHRKALLVPIAVVKVQRRDASVVAAQRTGATRLGDQDLLDLPPTPHDTFPPASDAPIRPPALDEECSDAMVDAPQ